MNSFLSRRLLNQSLIFASLGALVPESSIQARQSRGISSVNKLRAEDRIEIQDLIYRYGFAVDALDEQAFASCFTSDGILTGDPKETESKPIEAVAKLVMDGHRQFEYTMHVVVNHIHSGERDIATGVTYGIATWVTKQPGGMLAKTEHYMRYDDELIKVKDRWLFKKRFLSDLFIAESVVTKLVANDRGTRKVGSL